MKERSWLLVCIAGSGKIDVFAERLAGFRDELLETGKKIDHVIHVEETSNVSYGEEAAKKLLKKKLNNATGVFCANDLITIGVMMEARKQGIKVPDAFSVIGVDGIQGGEWLSPALTTISQPSSTIASSGVRLLLKMLQEEDSARENIILDPELLLRDSTYDYTKKITVCGFQ